MSPSSSYARKVPAHRRPVWPGAGPLLRWLDIELTERCNNDCVHCCVNRPAGDESVIKRELSGAEVKAVLAEAASLGCLTVRFTGGEPLLRTDFADLYAHARKLGLRVSLFTNATLLSPRLADLLARIPPLEKVEVSVYGMTAKTYEAVSRAAGSFEAARRGIDLLVERKVPFVVKSVVLPANRPDLPELKAWAGRLPWTKTAPAAVVQLDLRSRRDSESKNRAIRELRMPPQAALELLAEDAPLFVREAQLQGARNLGYRGKRLFDCGAGLELAALDAYGALQPCLLLRHPEAVVDLRRATLKEAMSEIFPRLRNTGPADADYLRRCAACFLGWMCLQCPAKSWAEHGTLDTPVEYYCDLSRAEAEFLGLLEPGERPWDVTDGDSRLRRLASGPPRA